KASARGDDRSRSSHTNRWNAARNTRRLSGRTAPYAMPLAARAYSSASRSSERSIASPPSAATSGIDAGAMKIGSIAIALIAEYGEFCPSAISLRGRSWTKARRASRIHRAKLGRSASSPMPQLARDGIEKSGTSTPACRPPLNSRGIHTLQHARDAAGEFVRLRQEADDDERFVGEVEEEAGVHDDATEFDLGKSNGLRQPAEAEHETGGIRQRRRIGPRMLERIVAEHFVEDERRAAGRAPPAQFARLVFADRGPGGIVGADDER